MATIMLYQYFIIKVSPILPDPVKYFFTGRVYHIVMFIIHFYFILIFMQQILNMNCFR